MRRRICSRPSGLATARTMARRSLYGSR
jgi:hypothetical protein